MNELKPPSCHGIRIPLPGALLHSFCLWNPQIWNTAQGIRNPTNDWNLESSSTDKESGIQYLEFLFHAMESRIQDCLGFPSHAAIKVSCSPSFTWYTQYPANVKLLLNDKGLFR